MTQAEWTRKLYARVRPQFDSATQADFDDILVHAGALLVCIDLIAMAVDGEFTLTPDELAAARGYAEGGKLLKSSAYLAEGLRKLPVAA
jgi:hypothetical protein